MTDKHGDVGEAADLEHKERPFVKDRGRTTSHERLQPPRRQSERVVLEKMTLYETKTKLYIIATDKDAQRFRVLKIDRMTDARPSSSGQNPPLENEADSGLTITEDSATYTFREKEELLETLRAGNPALKIVEKPCFGIAGFVRFTSTYHLILITKRSKVAVLGGHHVFHSEGTDLHEISPVPAAVAAEDARQKHSFMSVHLSKNFYFSYTYDITNTLQRNMLRGNAHLPFEDKFVWNWHLLRPLRYSLNRESAWLLPLVHGFVDQAKLTVFSRTVYITLIARRSRHFAGARFLRRGINHEGFVANEVETEQIVSDTLTSAFYSAGPSFHAHPDRVPTPPLSRDFPLRHQGRRVSPRYTSHVQIRGSIPLYWTQDAAKALKPPIEMALRDPFYVAAAKHFDSLFRSYGSACIILNLIKHHDDRESTLLEEFKDCIDYLNQFLPDRSKIDYIPYDLSSAKASRKNNKFDILEDCAEGALEKTGFFHSGAEAPRRTEHDGPYRSTPRVQKGVIRTNCIDCLDRTNIAQTVVGHNAFAHQLFALGLLASPNLDIECDAARLLESMYASHGDIIAMQYGGSNTVSTIDSYRPATPAWPAFSGGYSRDKVENMRRYYANSFSDHDKQAAIDLFLGIRPDFPLPPSWTYTVPETQTSYRNWYRPEHLDHLNLPPEDICARLQATIDDEDAADPNDLWRRYYRGDRWQTMQVQLPYRLPQQATAAPIDLVSRAPLLQSPFMSFSERTARAHPSHLQRRHSGGLRSWMAHRPSARNESQQGASARAVQPSEVETAAEPASTSSAAPPAPFSTTTEALATSLLQPRTRAEEAQEYDAWLSQFAHLSLSGHDHLSEKDRVAYETYIRRRAEGDVSNKDRLVFDNFFAPAEVARTLLGSAPDSSIPPATLKIYREAVHGTKGSEQSQAFA